MISPGEVRAGLVLRWDRTFTSLLSGILTLNLTGPGPWTPGRFSLLNLITPCVRYDEIKKFNGGVDRFQFNTGTGHYTQVRCRDGKILQNSTHKTLRLKN